MEVGIGTSVAIKKHVNGNMLPTSNHESRRQTTMRKIDEHKNPIGVGSRTRMFMLRFCICAVIRKRKVLMLLPIHENNLLCRDIGLKGISTHPGVGIKAT